MRDTIHCNKEILNANIHNATHKKELKLNIKAKLQDNISHSCEQNIKASGDFLYLKRCTSACLLCTFLELGASSIPRFPSQLFIQVKVCTSGASLPTSPVGSPHGSPHREVHRSINQGIWMTPSISVDNSCS